MAIKKGDKVKVDYTGKFDDGTVFDTSEGKQPLEFEVGKGMVIAGFDNALIGMNKGDEKEIKVEPKEGYGEKTDQLLKKMPKEHLPPGPEAKVGMRVGLSTKDGQQIPAKITEVADKDVTIDLNHPLAGKNLNFKIKIVDAS